MCDFRGPPDYILNKSTNQSDPVIYHGHVGTIYLGVTKMKNINILENILICNVNADLFITNLKTLYGLMVYTILQFNVRNAKTV